jgi:hypothetical protein
VTSPMGGTSTVTDGHIDRGLRTETGRDQDDGGHAQNGLLPHPGLMGRHAGCHGRQALRRDRGATCGWCGQPEGCRSCHGHGAGDDLLDPPLGEHPNVAGTGDYLCQRHTHHCESPDSTRDQPQANACPSSGAGTTRPKGPRGVEIGSSSDWGAGILLQGSAGGRTGATAAGAAQAQVSHREPEGPGTRDGGLDRA